MSALPPIYSTWDGEAWKPLPRFHNLVNAALTVGAVYSLVLHEQRSQASHNHEFAWIKEAWLNLPDHLAAQFPSPEALRKYALIKAGYCDLQTFVCGSRAEALRWAANIKPMDEFSIVEAHGTTVRRYTAQSQSRRAMGAQAFRDSKTKILEIIAAMLEVEPETLARERAA